MREKYIDEKVGGIWFIFGEHKDGKVDLANSDGDIFTHLTKEQADKIIEARVKFLKSLYSIIGSETEQKLKCPHCKNVAHEIIE